MDPRVCSDSERTLEEVVQKLQCFNPIWISYNDEVIFDNREASSFEEEIALYNKMKEFVEKHKRDFVIAVHIDIVSFHHSMITITGSRFSKECQSD